MRTLALVALLVAGCAKDTELLVVFSSDLPPTEYDSLLVDVKSDDGADVSHRYALTAGSLPSSVALEPSSGNPRFTLTADLELDTSILVERTAILRFDEGHARELLIALDADCEGVSCAAGETCIAGMCMDATVDPTTLPPIPKDPLAGIDEGLPADLGEREASVPDLEAPPDAEAVDLLPPEDLCTEPELPSPPSMCTVYSFLNNQMPSGLSASLSESTSVTFACGRMHVVVPADDSVRFDASAYAGTKGFTVSAAYTESSASTTAWAGVMAHDATATMSEPDGYYWALRTFPATSTWAIVTDDDSKHPGDVAEKMGTADVSSPTVSLTRIPGANSSDPSSYPSFVNGASTSYTPIGQSIKAVQTPALTIGDKGGQGGGITVDVDYIEVCSSS